VFCLLVVLVNPGFTWKMAVKTERKWLASYLSVRTISVRVGKSSSAAVPVHVGVPQSSVLGPILFTTHIAPIGRLIEQHGMHYHKYADDTQLYTSLTVPASSSLDHLARCTSELQHWYWANGLLLNQMKFEVAFFGTKQRLQQVTLTSQCYRRWEQCYSQRCAENSRSHTGLNTNLRRPC